ncbi:MAG TPA: hypothetical protein VIC84_08280 [Blastocatellia bacterium]|jgi:hypothetical protein
MRRAINICGVFCAIIISVQLFAAAFAQEDKLVGRWEGKVRSPQGERETNLVIKNEGGVYTGVMPGMRQGMEVQLKDFKIDGDKVTARADVEAPQGSITINYSFTLAGETLNGQGSLDFGGQAFTFDIDLKRVSANVAASAGQQGQQGQGQQGQGQQRQRVDAPQPQQKQSIDYFVGQWSYKYVGRESALWPAPRECMVTFTKRADGKSAEGVSECKHEGGVFKDNLLIVFDEAARTLGFTEKLGSGATLTSKGDWTSPISIRFAIDPVTAKGQKLQLRRTIAIVAAHSFTVTEELSEDGGPFARLGSATFTKVVAK